MSCTDITNLYSAVINLFLLTNDDIISVEFVYLILLNKLLYVIGDRIDYGNRFNFYNIKALISYFIFASRIFV